MKTTWRSVVAGAVLGAGMSLSSAANAVLVSVEREGSDCAFVDGSFDLCSIAGSPVIARFDANLDLAYSHSEFGVEVGEFIFGTLGVHNGSGTWSRTPTGSSPNVRFWATYSESTDTHMLTWYTSGDVRPDACADPGSEACLALAQLTTANVGGTIGEESTWSTPVRNDTPEPLTHLTFYDSGVLFGGDNSVPVPAALPLFASALAAVGVVGWRRRNAG